MGQFKDLHVTVMEMVENDTHFEDIAKYIMSVLPGCQYDEALSIIMEAEADYELRRLDDNLDDSMDGDHASALASVGWGTDEDYGYSCDDY
jgi:hypothetical protein